MGTMGLTDGCEDVMYHNSKEREGKGEIVGDNSRHTHMVSSYFCAPKLF